MYRKLDGGELLFYISECMESNVIRSCHDDLGHLGADKVIENIRLVYWFPRMRAKIKEYIGNC